MNEPQALKQPSRADKAVQASVLGRVRQTAPGADEEADETTVENRFGTTALRTTTLLDDDVEYCIDVMDEDSERVWHIAVWPSPSGTQLEVSHCLVVGSKAQARDVLRSLTGAPPHEKKYAFGSRTPGYVGRAKKKKKKQG